MVLLFFHQLNYDVYVTCLHEIYVETMRLGIVTITKRFGQTNRRIIKRNIAVNIFGMGLSSQENS